MERGELAYNYIKKTKNVSIAREKRAVSRGSSKE
jgi:hypothetical protein